MQSWTPSLLRLRVEQERRRRNAKIPEGSPAESVAKYSPHAPWPKQQEFLSLDCTEAFYGGSAGGGKSDVLLMAALQYVHVPNYSALILRRDFMRLNLPSAIMNRARAWLYNTDARWNGTDKKFVFPSGATIQFGYIDNAEDRFRYASSEFQFIGWDELTEFRLTDDDANPYLFLFSRLRKTRENPAPLRVRSASNPGNIGHAWVKKRFISKEAAASLRQGESGLFDTPHGGKFMPARIGDNPALDAAEYEKNLAHLPKVTRARLLAGDWDISESLIINPDWLRRYRVTPQYLEFDNQRIELAQCTRFATIDTAGTSRQKAEEQKGKPASWSVVAVWEWHRPTGRLFLRYVWRARVDWSGLKNTVPKVLADWFVRTAIIENAHLGPALAAELGSIAVLAPSSIARMTESARGAKLDRAIASGLLKMLEEGKLLVPEQAPWLADYETELTSWSGGPDETCDQIDVSSYAAWHVGRTSASWGGTINPGS